MTVERWAEGWENDAPRLGKFQTMADLIGRSRFVEDVD